MSVNLQSEDAREVLFPPLPLDDWEETQHTLHLFLQIVGKIRLQTTPKLNHWWHVTLYVSTRGITTGPMPYDGLTFELAFDFIDHLLHITTSRGDERTVSLQNKSVADFYRELFAQLKELSIRVEIQAVPYDVPAVSTAPFATDHVHATYDPEYAHRMWQVFRQVDVIFREFRGRFLGKSSPVHIFWHHMDMALAYFSGKEAGYEGGTAADKEAYSHEVISFGFWMGDANVRSPAFYSYTYPAPAGLYDEPLQPDAAFWNPDAGMALLMYDDVRQMESPRRAVLDFMESAYRAGATRAGWDVERLALPHRENGTSG
jgi:hypothetical protein